MSDEFTALPYSFTFVDGERTNSFTIYAVSFDEAVEDAHRFEPKLSTLSFTVSNQFGDMTYCYRALEKIERNEGLRLQMEEIT